MGGPRIIEKQSTITDLEDHYRLEFQMMPEISDSKNVNWNHMEIIGRSHPILGYASSGARTVSFTLMFFADPSHDDPTTLQKVSDNLKFLMSLAYPDYDGGRIKPPHKVLLKIGNQLKMKGVLESVNINYHTLWRDNLPVHAEASVTFIEQENDPIDYKLIRQHGGV
jgi:hypothetical protein